LKKIIFLDIDGTIRDFDGHVPVSAIEAIKEARKNGHEVCISTGRPFCQIEKSILEIGFDGVISGSGSYVEYQGSCVRHVYFTTMSYIALCNYLVENHCIVEIQRHNMCNILKKQEPDFVALGEKIQGKLGENAKKLTVLPTPVESTMDLTQVEKLLFFSNRLSNEELQRKWGENLCITAFSIPNSEKWGGEITPQGVHKAEGIRSILQQGNFSQEDVIAIGDSENDLEMLKFASVGVAMGNSKPSVIEAADMVTASLREDGIYKAFLQLQLIG
jgi:Cof subfamily protein (haloacid dehalogenase superfamily)